MTTRNSQVSNSSTIQQSGLFRCKPWLIVICTIVVVCLLLVGGLSLAGPTIADRFFTDQIQLISVEPAPGAVLSYAHLKEGIPFSLTAQFTYKVSDPSDTFALIWVEAEAGTGNSVFSGDRLADIGRVEEGECPVNCQVTVRGTLYPETVYQGKITLHVGAGFLHKQHREMVISDNFPEMWIEYPVSEDPAWSELD